MMPKTISSAANAADGKKAAGRKRRQRPISMDFLTIFMGNLLPV
jgi:hypothetical protein